MCVCAPPFPRCCCTQSCGDVSFER
uniref:Uncharacterized protein n=1 Tax=Arundo donax TaxID=35708 RepID=A0A0A8Z5R1_ARUDO